MERLEADTRSRRQITPAMVQQMKLSTLFELKGKYGLSKGCLVRVSRPVGGTHNIETKPCEHKTYTEVSHEDFHAGDTCMFVGFAFDYWSKKPFLLFTAGERTLYYDYSQHGAGDTSFSEVFVKIDGTDDGGSVL